MGRHQIPMAMIGMAMGGNVRVGFEDNVYLSKGVLAKSNGELVEKVVRIAMELGREIATPDEAREILGLKK
jgi:3-keto-5-aminohexanoate cleavage enzyme